jgi:hypothetical protein
VTVTPPDFDTIPTALQELERWLFWIEEERPGKDGEVVTTKVPLWAVGRRASTTNRTTWLSYTALTSRWSGTEFAGVGIVLGLVGDDLHLGGIDLDACVDADGSIAPWAQLIIAALPSYKERSPSFTGIKAFFLLTATDAAALRPLFGIAPNKWGSKRSVAGLGNGVQHGPAVEVYLGPGRYFACTGRPFGGNGVSEVALLDRAVLERLAALINAVVVPAKAPGKGGGKGRDTSRSAAAFRLGAQLIRKGATFEEMCEGIRDHPDTAEWFKEKGEADDLRELHNIWKNAGGRVVGDRGRPIIYIIAGELERLADEAEAALIAGRSDVYQRGSLLMRPASLPMPTVDGGIVMSPALLRLTLYGLLERFCRHAQWVRWDGRRKAWVAANPPFGVAQTLLDRAGQWRFPTLRGILSTPTLRSDGSLLAAPGYDAASGLYLYLDPNFRMPEIPEEPRRAEAETALALLDGLLDEFPFVSKASRSVALSLILTAVVRGAMPVAPIHAATAPSPSSGKSYLFDVAAAVASGEQWPVIFAGSGAEELEKKVNGLLIHGIPLFSVDNLNIPLQGDVFCQASERPLLMLRRLKESDPIKTTNTALIGATGNNLTIHDDLNRRVVMASLDARMERPELRRFQGNPFKTVAKDRGRYVAAALTIVRACLSDPNAPDPYPVASYEDWTRLVRRPLVWLGRADPANTMTALREADPTRGELIAVMNAWASAIGIGIKITAAEIVEGIYESPPAAADAKARAGWKALGAALIAACGKRDRLNARDIGNWLRSKRKRIVGDRRFVGSPGHAGVVEWRLVDATEAADTDDESTPGHPTSEK